MVSLWSAAKLNAVAAEVCALGWQRPFLDVSRSEWSRLGGKSSDVWTYVMEQCFEELLAPSGQGTVATGSVTSCCAGKISSFDRCAASDEDSAYMSDENESSVSIVDPSLTTILERLAAVEKEVVGLHALVETQVDIIQRLQSSSLDGVRSCEPSEQKTGIVQACSELAVELLPSHLFDSQTSFEFFGAWSA